MADSTVTPETDAASDTSKARFSRALDEAKAGAQQLGKEAQDRADLYRDKLTATGSEWANEAKARTGQAREKATGLAVEGKAKASEALGSLAKLVEDNVGIVDEKVGAKYGDYARSAAKGLNDAAAKLESKDLNELGEDVKQFVRTSPGLAIGIAAAGGFLLARLFKGSSN